MSEENPLKSAFEREATASPSEVEASLFEVTRRAERRRSMRQAGATAAAVFVVMLMGGGLLLANRNDDRSTPVAAGPNVSAGPQTTVPVTTTTAVNPAANRPAVLVASTINNDLVLLNSQTGEIIRTLDGLDHIAVDNEGGLEPNSIPDVQLTPDGKTVFYRILNGTCDAGEIRKVSVDGGAPKEVAFASWFQVSPDGSQLAYGGGDCDIAWNLHVVDLASGVDRLIADGTDGRSNAGHFEWDPSSKTIWAEMSASEGESPVRSYVEYSIDKSVNGLNPERITSLRPNDFPGPYFGNEVRLPDNTYFAVEYTGIPSDARQDFSKIRLVVAELHFSANETENKVLREVAVGDVTRTYTSLAADSSGKYLLYLSNDELRVSDDGARTVVLAKDLTAADW